MLHFLEPSPAPDLVTCGVPEPELGPEDPLPRCMYWSSNAVKFVLHPFSSLALVLPTSRCSIYVYIHMF